MDIAPLSEKMINKYFKMAKNVSELSDFKKFHLGAIMVYKNKVIAAEYNTTKTNPLQKEYNKLRGFEEEHTNDGAIHSEMACLIRTRNMNIEWHKVSIFIYRQHKDDTLAYCRPCPACMKAIKDRGIKKIYYTTENGFAYERIE